MTLVQLIPVLSTAIGPVILISGVGLLLLSMTNRLGRTIDRSRGLLETRNGATGLTHPQQEAQLAILWQRAQLLRTAITLATIAALLAAVLVIVLFVSVLLKLESGMIAMLLFIACMLAIIASLVYFLRDIEMSLRALAMEMDDPTRGE